MAVISCVLASLFVALTVVPFLSSVILPKTPKGEGNRVRRLFDRVLISGTQKAAGQVPSPSCFHRVGRYRSVRAFFGTFPDHRRKPFSQIGKAHVCGEHRNGPEQTSTRLTGSRQRSKTCSSANRTSLPSRRAWARQPSDLLQRFPQGFLREYAQVFCPTRCRRRCRQTGNHPKAAPGIGGYPRCAYRSEGV